MHANRICSKAFSITSQDALLWMQAKREEYWDTQPHYGGDKGASPFC